MFNITATVAATATATVTVVAPGVGDTEAGVYQDALDRAELGAIRTAEKAGALESLMALKGTMSARAWEKHLDEVRTWLTVELGLDDAQVIHPLLERELRRGEDTAEVIERRLLAAEEQGLLATAVALATWTEERSERFLETRAQEPAVLERMRLERVSSPPSEELYRKMPRTCGAYYRQYEKSVQDWQAEDSRRRLAERQAYLASQPLPEGWTVYP